jgi:uncharacterized phage protein (TIGR02220 family)
VKRFTETTRWNDPWFRRLEPKLKCLWDYLCSLCDVAGVIDLDFELASFQIGGDISHGDLEAFGNRIETLPNGKLYIPSFVPFQYGKLSEACKPHQQILATISRHHLDNRETNLVENKPYEKGSYTLQDKNKTRQDKEKDSVPEDDEVQEKKEKGYPEAAERIIDHLNECTGKKFRKVPSHLALIAARLKEPGVTEDGVKAMIAHRCDQWKDDPVMDEFLRPATLFGKEKFGGYYDSAPQQEPEAPPAEYQEHPDLDRQDIIAGMQQAREQQRLADEGSDELELVA